MEWKTPRRSGAFALVVAAVAVGLSACGGAKAPSVATVGTTPSSSGDNVTTTSTSDRSEAPPNQAQLHQNALKFARCMRSNGVPNFPDPNPGGGFSFSAGAGFNPSSPAVQRAQGKCQKFMGGGPPGPGSTTHPSAQWLAHMIKVAQCMRRHGITNFPDPRTSVPPNPFAGGGTGVISDIEGVILIFPTSIDEQSPQFTRAADACQFPLHNH